MDDWALLGKIHDVEVYKKDNQIRVVHAWGSDTTNLIHFKNVECELFNPENNEFIIDPKPLVTCWDIRLLLKQLNLLT